MTPANATTSRDLVATGQECQDVLAEHLGIAVAKALQSMGVDVDRAYQLSLYLDTVLADAAMEHLHKVYAEWGAN